MFLLTNLEGRGKKNSRSLCLTPYIRFFQVFYESICFHLFALGIGVLPRFV